MTHHLTSPVGYPAFRSMVVVDHEPSGWFLVRDGDRLLFDVNCSHGAVSHEFLMELNASEREGYAVHGRPFLSDLAEKVQSSAPGAPGAASPYRDRILGGSDRGKVDEAAIAWLKGRGRARPEPINQFWGANYYAHPPLTDEMLRRAEDILKVRLPPELVSLLRVQNGGYTRRFAHPMSVRTTWAENHVPLQDLFGIVTDEGVQTAQNMLSSAYMAQEWGLPPRQVLLSGDGHWWITLDYRRGPEPSVAWIDVECGEDVQIAPSFAAFLDGLVPAATYDEDDDA